MKHFLIVNLFCCIAGSLVMSCNKSTSEIPVPKTTTTTNVDLKGASASKIVEAITGDWQLLYQEGGFSGNEHTNFNNVVYQFGATSFTVNNNGSTTTWPYNWTSAFAEVGGGVFIRSNNWYFDGISNDTLYAHQSGVSDGYKFALFRIAGAQ